MNNGKCFIVKKIEFLFCGNHETYVTDYNGYTNHIIAIKIEYGFLTLNEPYPFYKNCDVWC